MPDTVALNIVFTTFCIVDLPFNYVN